MCAAQCVKDNCWCEWESSRCSQCEMKTKARARTSVGANSSENSRGERDVFANAFQLGRACGR